MEIHFFQMAHHLYHLISQDLFKLVLRLQARLSPRQKLKENVEKTVEKKVKLIMGCQGNVQLMEGAEGEEESLNPYHIK